MSVPVQYSKDNDRFIRHSFLSISPTSTTVFSRSFDKVTNKYYQPCNIKETVDTETGEIITTEETIKPPTFKKHIGTLSDKARRQLNRSVYTLISMVDEKILIDGENKEKITNKSIEIAPQEINNDLEKYLKTEIDVTPKSKKTAKVGILSLN